MVAESISNENGRTSSSILPKPTGLMHKFWHKAIKPGLLYSTSFITALPNGLLSLLAPTHAAPQKLITLSWWRSLSTGQLIHSLANGVASLSINIIMNLLFFPLAADEFYRNIKTFRHHPGKNISAITLGGAGALGAAAIAYMAFTLFPDTLGGEILACSAALVNFVIYVATRYIGATNVLKRIANLFDDDIQTQKEFITLLDHLNPTHCPMLNDTYQQIHQHIFASYPNAVEAKEEDLQLLAEALARALSEYAEMYPDLINNPSQCAKLINGLLTFFDLTMAIALVGGPAMLTFSQKAFEGVQKIGELWASQSLTDLNVWTKRTIAFVPGLASGAFYGNFGFDFRHLIIDFAKTIYHDPKPKDILFAALLLIGNVLSASGMQNVATSIVKDENNIVFVADNAYGLAFIMLNALGGFVVNSASTFKKAFLSTKTTPDSVASISSLADHFRRTNDHPLAKHTANAIRSLSLFALDENLVDEEKRTEPIFAPM